MNDQLRAAALQPRLPVDMTTHGVDRAAALLHQLFRRFDGHLAMRLWDGTLLRLGIADHQDGPEPRYTLVCRSPGVVRLMVLGRDPLRMAEAYFRGEIDIEGDFFAAMQLKDQLESIRVSPRDRLRTYFAAIWLSKAKADDQSVVVVVNHFYCSGQSPSQLRKNCFTLFRNGRIVLLEERFKRLIRCGHHYSPSQ